MKQLPFSMSALYRICSQDRDYNLIRAIGSKNKQNLQLGDIVGSE
jgi:hypothetical protein